MPDDKRFDRRRFFREGLREFLKPLSRVVAPMERALNQLEAMSATPPPVSTSRAALPSVWLRPPSAAFPDQSFRDTCSLCRKCVDVCPVQCIKIDDAAQRGDGAPFIAPEEAPCVVCEGLLCTHHCPTGALAPIPLADIDMGTAVVNHQICIRSNGEDCTICIDVCPIGSMAIELRDGRVEVHDNGCIGCGLCQHRCPTDPKSIIVLSREIWEKRTKR